MICPYCGHLQTKVVGSSAGADRVTRRRMCMNCRERFTTVEFPAQGTFHLTKDETDSLEQIQDKLLAAYTAISATLRRWK